MFATELDGSGAGIAWFDNVTVEGGDGNSAEYVHITTASPATFTVAGAANTTVQLDFYTVMNNGVTEVQIEPSSFGGYFYVEAQTLYRREDTGKDMAAEIIIPKAKVQSGFTFTMAASGDPSTFDFVMDAFPGYTRFDNTKKQMCVIQIIGDDKKAEDEAGAHTHDALATDDSPSYGDTPVPPVTTYTVTQNLTNVTSDFSETTVDVGSALVATLTAESGYDIDTVEVTMGGTDITSTAWDSTTGKVTIEVVSGNVVITASATE